ncbi:M20/M25/M40 family metallo-hydrolase [uncultured Paludibaculum sp.]|uniref:M20/M25/M40 family metallo-hydrolase n=1 Tax=uncultured Paludibaculum sp. TaxID=1765020 RepID=UPI002AABB2D5|nr:M20/M25/M40 family metallo-hydrolase [uncultured Paludibaculum sp.]
MRLALLLLATALFVTAEERINSDVNQKLRQEEAAHSQVMKTLHMLTDRYGPRLTGSPNHEAAAKWARDKMTEWGLKNAHLEPWDFGHPGWLNDRASGYVTAPLKDNLVFEVLSWTPSTNGPAKSQVVLVDPPKAPTQEEFTAWLAENKTKVGGHIVFVGKAAVVPVSFEPLNKRMDEEAIKRRLSGQGGPGRPPAAKPEPGKLTAAQINTQIDAWLVANGAPVRVNDAGMAHGMVRAFNNRTYDLTKVVPTVVLRNEDYGRIARLLDDGEKVEMEFDITNHVYPEGKTTYNVVAEIPGTDKADEVVMLGGHLDSWHSATGATDNGIGSSMMMEAARLIQTLGIQPRRTIRIALWSAEEQGLLGSQAYVKEHFGTFEEPKAEFGKLVAYFNIDSGTGRVRMANVFGPQEAADVLKSALDPFADLGVAGASAGKSRRTGGTDSTSFNAAGLAGIGLGQDPIEYFGTTWHTNLDTYERIVPEDAMNASIVIAGAVWHLANRDEMLPRFTKEQMPEPVKTPVQ